MAKNRHTYNRKFEKSPHFLWQSRSTLSNEIDLVLQFVYIQRTNKKTTHELFAHESLIKYLVEPTHLLTEAVLKNSEANRFRGSNCIKIGRDDRD